MSPSRRRSTSSAPNAVSASSAAAMSGCRAGPCASLAKSGASHRVWGNRRRAPDETTPRSHQGRSGVPGEGGGYAHGSAVRRRFEAARDRAKLRPLRFNDLRHTFGSLAINFESLVEVQHWMGHAEVKTTMRYLHYKNRGEEAARLGPAFQAGSPAASTLQAPASTPLPSRSTRMRPRRGNPCPHRLSGGSARNGVARLLGLPCRRSWVRVPYSLLEKAPQIA